MIKKITKGIVKQDGSVQTRRITAIFTSKKDAEIITLTDDTGYEITLPFYVLERMADQDREKRRS